MRSPRPLITKIAAQDVDALLLKCASAMRAQSEHIRELESQLASRDRRSHAEKIASLAAERGIMGEDEAHEYADTLAGGDKDLAMIEDFVSRTAAGVPLADPLQKTASGYAGGGDTAEDRFTNFLLTSPIG